MKKTLCMWVIALNSFFLSSVAQNNNDEINILEITGAALLNDQRTDDYAISVYLDGIKIDSMYTRSKKTVKFYVSYNEVYTFLFQKENCIDKIVIVNTHIPEGLSTMADNTFDFEIEMSQSLTKKTEDLIDYPVAVLMINRDEELLEASAEYHKFTHEDPEIIKNEAPQKRIIKTGFR